MGETLFIFLGLGVKCKWDLDRWMEASFIVVCFIVRSSLRIV
jgi:hypothetical protein